ncbi:MAG: hypothetical protein JWP35_706 [Caulobacter sp.]|nr:hypothetical protein [Caulobacter sp.]
MDVSHPTFQPRAYSVKDFCRLYSLGRSTTFKMIKDGRLRSVTVMGRRLIPADAAEELLSSRPRQ